MKQIRANDYINTMRNYLKSYNYYAQYLSNVKESVKDIDRQLSAESIKIARYGNDPAGAGQSGLTTVEQSASIRMSLEMEKQELLNSSLEVESLMARINNTLLRLPLEEQELIKGFYIEGLSYGKLALRYCYSERWCRKRVRLAEEKMAFMMFGPKATESVSFIDTDM